MRRHPSIISLTLLFLLTFPAFADTAHDPAIVTPAISSDELEPGVVVEEVKKNSEGEKAGIQIGDVLLGWVRGENKGEVESPFDLRQIAVEQASKGAVTLVGLAGAERRSWVLGSDTWGIVARPNLSQSLWPIYLEGQELAKAGKLNEAAEHWGDAAIAAQKSQSAWLGSWFLFHAADVLARARKWNEADAFYQQAIDQAKNAEPVFKAQLFQEWARTYEYRNDWANAEKYHQQSLLERQRSGGNNMLVSVSLDYLGLVAWGRGDLAKAEQYYRKALAIQEELSPSSVYVALSLNNLGILSYERGDMARAEEYYRRALRLQEMISADSSNLAATLADLGKIAGDRGELAKAGTYYQRALTIMKKVAPESISTASVLSHLAGISLERNDLAQAENYERQAFTLRQKLDPGGLDVASSLDEFGNIARHQGDLTQAEECYRQALAIWEKLNPGSKSHAETLAALAGVMREKQQPDTAIQLYQQALGIMESQTARLGGADEDHYRFRAKFANYYTDYADLLIAQKRPELAFEALERSRARTLLETLASAHVNIRNGVDSSLLEQERRLREAMTATYGDRIRLLSGEHTEQQVAGLDQEAKKLLARYDDVEGQIRVSSPAYAALIQPQPLSTKEIQKELLGENTLLLEYSLGKERSYVFAVGANSLMVYQLPKRATIEQAAQRVYDLLNAPNRRDRIPHVDAGAEYSEAAARLSRMLLQPVASQLGRKRLLIVGDGALHYVPFSALPSPGKWQEPLMVRHEIINLPCASVLSALRQERMGRKAAPRAVAVLADPVFDIQDVRVKGTASKDRSESNTTRRGMEEEMEEESLAADSLTRSVADIGVAAKGTVYLPRLQLTRQEARSILAATPPGQAMPALDFKASRATALSPSLAQYRIVHFATHGLVNSKHPELSGLVLSLVDEQGRPQNGFLGLQDIYNLNLPAELVVLSACETGLGKNIQGEGLIGLTRGFMYAGASRVVASLWKIDDLGTAELMGEFYRAMEQQGMRPAAALRAAQIHMWKQKRWSSPYYWAAFQIHGEWK